MPAALLSMFQELRYAARSVTRARGLTAVLVLSLALGTGTNAAVFGVVHALLIRPPAGITDAGRLVSIHTSEFSGAPYGRTSLADYLAISSTPSLASVAAVDDNEFANVRVGQSAMSVRTAAVTANFFDVLRMRPHRGRLLTAADGTTTPRGAVISASLAEALGGVDETVGGTLQTGPESFVVVGVAPPKFRGLQASRVADIWIPLAMDDAARGDRRLHLAGRRAATLDQVQTALDGIAIQLAQQYPETNRGTLNDPEAPRRFNTIAYSQLEPDAKSQATMVAALVVGAVALLLISACVNAGSLLLSRAMARRREVAVRMALGAYRGRVIRQLLAESLLVSLAGGTCGLLFAYWTTTAIPSLFAPEHAALLDTRINGTLILLTIGVAALAGALFGIAPALQGTGASAALALRADAGSISEQHGGTRTRGLLITAQLALSTVLLIGTALLMGSLARALQGDFGFAARNVAVLSVQNPGGNCTIFDSVRGARFQQRVAETLPETTGIEAVGFAATAPLGRSNSRQYSVQAGATLRDRVDLDVNVVSASYFRTMRVPLVEGRYFVADDSARAERVVIVDELLARRYFGISAVGQHLLDAAGEPIRVVGVVRSGRYRTLQDAPQPTVYVPLSQEHMACGYLFVRTAGDPAPLLPLIQRRLMAVDGGVTINRAATLETHLGEALAIDRLTTTLVGLCGIIALLMGAMGVYGVMSDGVLRRTREIGLRMALGAGRRQVVWLVVAETLYLTAAGVFVGIAASLMLERVAATVVHGLPGVDRMTLTATPAVLALVVMLAAALPLRRALAVNPTVALRAE